MEKSSNVVWHPHKVSKKDREKIKNQKACLLWFTGLPSAGKSTVAQELEFELNKKGLHTYVLDGDNIRHGLNKNLGFTAEDRQENIRRIGEAGKLFVDAGIITLTAFISPYEKDRKTARELLEEGEFIEVFVKCSLETCIERDPKGLYKKAIAGEIPNFTGISDPYEEPSNPEIVLDTDELSVEESVEKIIDYFKDKEIIK
ncbi:MAG: adenylyl-sulfate kinase [Actinomycetia bacterium]|nr:adenylyl-sulfate kinase [Actinomycetes bacterium]